MKPELYRPSNSTDGDGFYSAWCADCYHDDPKNGKHCQILGLTFMLSERDEGYPREWRYVDDVPTCTAFAEREDFSGGMTQSEEELQFSFTL